MSNLVSANDPNVAEKLGLSGGYTEAGVRVSEGKALSIATVWACVQVIAQGIASMPWHVIRSNGGTRVVDYEHPVDELLSERPNTEQSAVDFLQTMLSHVLLRGRAIAQIERDREGWPVAIWPLLPGTVRLDRNTRTGQLEYTVTPQTASTAIDYAAPVYRRANGQSGTLLAADVLHIKGLSLNGVDGLPVLQYIRESLGLSIAAEAYGARMFKNDARPSMVLQHDGVLGDQAASRLRDSVEANYSGKNQHRVMVLEEGMKATTIGIPPEDAQFLETRQFQVVEICRWFGVPPHMVADLSRATFSNIEHQGLSFIRNTLLPWARKLEAEANAKLLRKYNAGGERYTSHFDLNELARADQKTRYESHALGLLNGFLSIDEVRAIEGMNPLPDGAGETHRVPLNTEQLEDTDGDGEPDAPPADASTEPATPPADGQQRAAFAAGALDAMAGIMAREAGAFSRNAKASDPAWAAQWFEQFRSSAVQQLARVLVPLAHMRGARNPDELASRIARDWFAGHAEGRLDDLASITRDQQPRQAEAFDVVDALIDAAAD